MMNNLPDDQDILEDDAPVKVAYHTAPISEEPESIEEEDPLDKEEPQQEESEPEEEKDPLDDEEPEESEESVDQSVSKSASDLNEYYLQTVKAGEQPEWQSPKDELNVFSQPIDDGLMQYFAYPKDLGKTADDVPNAEVIAAKNKSDNPIIIIDQTKDYLTPGCCLELILAKNGHALIKTDSNLDNLEANITSLIDMAKMNFGISVEHFISTSNVSPEVEQRLNDLEDAGGGKEAPETAVGSSNFEQVSVYNQDTPSLSSNKPVLAPKGDRSKLAVFIPVLILIIIAGVMVYYRHNLLSIINPPKQEAEIKPVPTETPTPTPTVGVERSKYTVRVLNGTPKSGAAGVLAEELKAKGWLIDKTGNATSSAIAESYVQGKVDLTDVIKALIADVSDYQVTPSAVILKPSDKADLEFVIGKK